MMSSHSRVLANLSSKENMSPSRKRSSEEAFSSTYPENVSKRRTVDSFMLPKTKSLFSSKPSNKGAINKKQASIKSYYKEGLKQKSKNVMTIFDENKENTKKKTNTKEDDAFSLMCAEEASEKYWELLAEERRKGLETALKENKELADEIREKDETIQELKTEVSELKETAKHAEYLASVLEELGKDCNVTNNDSEAEESDAESDSENEVFDEKEISVSYPSQDEDCDEEDETSGPDSTSNEDSSIAGFEQNIENSGKILKQDSPTLSSESALVKLNEKLAKVDNIDTTEEESIKRENGIVQDLPKNERSECDSVTVAKAKFIADNVSSGEQSECITKPNLNENTEAPMSVDLSARRN